MWPHRRLFIRSMSLKHVYFFFHHYIWKSFCVLCNMCCNWWNFIFFTGSGIEELEHSGLARQVSTLLTNHLARATECIGNEAAGTEALQDVLSLLNTLARSRMGRAILSQPACVSKLLSLLLDQRWLKVLPSFNHDVFLAI